MMLEIGEPHTLSIRTATFTPFRSHSPVSILYVSDLHLKRTSASLIAGLHHIVQEIQPHLVLLGGDIVDSKSGLEKIIICIKPMVAICPVWAVSGNHDDYANRDAVRQQVEASGGQWLENQSTILACGVGTICLDGTAMPQHDSTAFSILCAHYPSVFRTAATYGYDLVLAGHLHGSQIVFAKHRERLYPGAWFYQWNGDKFTQGKTTMLVSRGANDTIPIRLNCPREVILCQIS